jgi:hypothetical protein
MIPTPLVYPNVPGERYTLAGVGIYAEFHATAKWLSYRSGELHEHRLTNY